MDFIALDVETANPNLSSICQIALVPFIDGAPLQPWSRLVNPHDYFDPINESIHGITERDVAAAPSWDSVGADLAAAITGRIVVTHGSFDRAAITRACARHAVHPPDCTWIDTCMVARRAWSDVAQSGYGLAALAQKLGIDFRHHDAAEDARAAGLILLRASQETGLDLHQWLKRVRQPIAGLSQTNIAATGAQDGPLAGNTIVFTGALSMPRAEAARHAAQIGCDVGDGVNKHTTLLVVGEQDLNRLAGQERSAKHRKAEDLIAKGQSIRILSETDFLAMVGLS